MLEYHSILSIPLDLSQYRTHTYWCIHQIMQPVHTLTPVKMKKFALGKNKGKVMALSLEIGSFAIKYGREGCSARIKSDCHKAGSGPSPVNIEELLEGDTECFFLICRT